VFVGVDGTSIAALLIRWWVRGRHRGSRRFNCNRLWRRSGSRGCRFFLDRNRFSLLWLRNGLHFIHNAGSEAIIFDR
jgi:hypothetical protein